MSNCKECAERREKVIDAVLAGRLASAAGHVVVGAAEMIGIKPKAKKVPAPKTIKTED